MNPTPQIDYRGSNEEPLSEERKPEAEMPTKEIKSQFMMEKHVNETFKEIKCETPTVLDSKSQFTVEKNVNETPFKEIKCETATVLNSKSQFMMEKNVNEIPFEEIKCETETVFNSKSHFMIKKNVNETFKEIKCETETESIPRVPEESKCEFFSSGNDIKNEITVDEVKVI